MPIDFSQRQTVEFAAFAGPTRTIPLNFIFPSPVRRAEAIVIGARWGFSDDDRSLFRVQLNTDVTIVSGSPLVNVNVNYGLRDNSGFFDDRYDAFVEVMVIADRE